jgi:hypothetical protein
MEIKEIISSFINENSNTLDVVFRTTEDSDEEVRQDKIFIEDLDDFDYDFFKKIESGSFLNEEEFEYDYDEIYLENELDEEELLSFLNEYYLVNPNKLPQSEPF